MDEVTQGHMGEERQRERKESVERNRKKKCEGESQIEKVVLKWMHQAAPCHREREERSPPSF